ncbi:MAG: hypothetical protein IPL71_15580 [Anaerolineales bacterium]|uniref:hypothetical protein n=1 Tax=Candidatus Villigracilis proximus TaxID=3140683 RepID=UPI003136C13E|nr:hypothetical protein [Anaerolineales bacterium]
MDIHAGIIAASLLIVVAAFFVIRAAIRVMQTARKLSFYSLRRMHNANAWKLFFFALLLFACAIWLPFYGEPMVFEIFPPSPQTLTPSVSETPTLTLTPFLPVAIEALFEGQVTPNPDAVFTAIQFSTEFDGTNPIDPKAVFELPIEKMYGGFDYNNTIPGVQWTSLWYHDGKLIWYEPQPWDGGTGGIGGYTECSDPVGGWQPGQYEVQIFMGYDWKVIGRFRVFDNLSTPTATGTPILIIPETPTP